MKRPFKAHLTELHKIPNSLKSNYQATDLHTFLRHSKVPRTNCEVYRPRFHSEKEISRCKYCLQPEFHLEPIKRDVRIRIFVIRRWHWISGSSPREGTILFLSLRRPCYACSRLSYLPRRSIHAHTPARALLVPRGLARRWNLCERTTRRAHDRRENTPALI